MSIRVVIVDDNRSFLEEISEALAAEGFEVIAFSDSSKALETVLDIDPDIIVLDLNMEGVSGFQIADRVSRSCSGGGNPIPMIAISGYFTEQEHESAIKLCGIDSRLVKPFDPEELIFEIRKLCG